MASDCEEALTAEAAETAEELTVALLPNNIPPHKFELVRLIDEIALFRKQSVSGPGAENTKAAQLGVVEHTRVQFSQL
jgi:hypothetical protein